MRTIRVVAFTASTAGVTLYCEDGQTVELKSSDHRTHGLTERLTPLIARRETVEVTLSEFRIEVAMAEKSKGVMRFFRIAKEKLSGIFGIAAEKSKAPDNGFHNDEQQGEAQPGTPDVTPEQIAALEAANSDLPSDALVAVVNNTPIINAEALEGQMKSALHNDNVVGFTRFMERLATVAKERKHTSQELLEFLKVADLPIANDGSIIGYKALRAVDDGYFVDHHSGRVKQRVGSRVEMKVEMVDDNRRRLCSNGLHIARRKYLTSYGSNGAITLVKIAPEDVISVPVGEPDKMRVAAYQIVAELPKEARSQIRSNLPMTQIADVQTILGNVIAGNHAALVEIVHIGGQMGQNVTVSQVVEGAVVPTPVEIDETKKARVIDDQEAAKDLSPKAINDKVRQTLEEAKKEQTVAPTADPKPAQPAVAADNVVQFTKADVNKLTEDKNQRKAVMAVLGGMSKREAERTFSVSTRTIGRLMQKLNAA